MNLGFFPFRKKRDKGGRAFSLPFFVLSAVAFIIVGILISANFDLTTQSNAQAIEATYTKSTPANPVVENEKGELESPFVRVIDKVKNAVIHISARTKDNNAPPWHRGPNISTSSGSGFFFREDGYILTNNHVVDGAQALTVTTASGYNYEAIIIGSDPMTDLAVIKIEADEKITFIPFGNSEEISVGDWAIAIGNPFPQQGLDRTVTVGVISAKGRSNLRFNEDTPMYQNYIQTDASINPGNSGGPLLNLRGECVGVNAAISSPTGGSVGIGFAIPINLARSVVPDLIATGKVSRGWLGVWLGNLTEEEARRQGLNGINGVKIDTVVTNSPAYNAGIRSGDIITEIDNHEVSNNNQLSVLISQAKEGQSLPMTVVRDGEEIEFSPVIGDLDKYTAANTPADNDAPTVRWRGMELTPFTEDIAKRLGGEHLDGVYIKSVTSGSTADKASITEGSIILQINNQSVKTIEDVYQVSTEISRFATRIPMIVIEADGSLAQKVLRP